MDNNELIATLTGLSIGLVLVILLFLIAFVVVYIVGLSKLFEKAGKPRWAAIIPFYNTYVLVEIAGLNWWYFLIVSAGSIFTLLDIKGFDTVTNIASMVAYFLIFYNIGKKIKSNPTGVAVAGSLVSPIMVCIIGFSSKYQFDNSIDVNVNGLFGERSKSNNNSVKKYCLGCGSPLKPGSNFCENCGKKVE